MEELLHLEVDGRATQDQLAEIQSLRAANPEVQSYYEDLQEMHRVLESTKEVTPPAGLRQEILAKVAAAQPPWSLDETRNRAARNLQAAGRGRNPGQRFLDALRESMRPREAFAFGLGAAACLMIVFLAGWERFESIGFPDNALPGSMIPLETSVPLQPIDQKMLEASGMRTIAELSRTGNLVQVSLQVEAGSATLIEVFSDTETLAARSIAQTTDALPLAASIVDGSVRIQHQGSAHYNIRFEEHRARPSEIRVQVKYQGQTMEVVLRTRK